MATVAEVKQTIIDTIEKKAKEESVTVEQLATLSGAFAQVAYVQPPREPRVRTKK